MPDGEQLRKYACLIASRGANIQKGQDVFITAGLDQPEFVRMLVEECYRLGANRVVVDWEFQPLALLDNKYCTLETLSDVRNYEKARFEYYVNHLPCRIYLESDDPEGLQGINQEKDARAGQARRRIFKAFRDAMENKYQWCIAAVPGKAWAGRLFPDLPEDLAEEQLWDKILFASRATEDPVQAWDDHNRDLHHRCDYLNSLQIRKLHYYGDNGTNLTVGMIPQARFCGGSEKTLQGVEMNPNIPTEECFISPDKNEAEGIVYATKPIAYQGELIEGASITFHKGKAIRWHAERNETLLTNLIEMDEGSHYLGECALVPQSSPIARSGLLYLSTLFDENAACHLALGAGFPDTIENFERYTLEECREMGVNDSIIHEDFMIGYEGLNIDAVIESGDVVPVFRNGEWAFD